MAIFRRRAGADAEGDPPADEHSTTPPDDTAAPSGTRAGGPVLDAAGKPARPDGPFDVEEVAATASGAVGASGATPGHTPAELDLGGLRVPAVQGLSVQLQMDKATGRASTAVISVGEAGLQLMVVAAARSRALWPETRERLAADAAGRGARVTEVPGPYGPALQVVLPVTLPDGRQGMQPQVVLGIDGPRWMLRATLLGRAAMEAESRDQMMALLRRCVVVRGGEPMPPGEIVTLRPPPGIEAAAAADAAEEPGTSVDADLALEDEPYVAEQEAPAAPDAPDASDASPEAIAAPSSADLQDPEPGEGLDTGTPEQGR
jgi:hypothetical protein